MPTVSKGDNTANMLPTLLQQHQLPTPAKASVLRPMVFASQEPAPETEVTHGSLVGTKAPIRLKITGNATQPVI